MNKFIILLFAFISLETWGACSSPISRTNSTTNQVLTSAKYNTDHNTAYSKINELDGDCITDATIATAKYEDLSVTEAKIAAAVIAKFVPTGTIVAYSGTAAPTGYLLCDGSQVNRTTYAALYAITGDVFGNGNGTTTFHLPDLRGRFLRGVDGGVGRDVDRAARTAMNSGGNTGDNVGSVQANANKTHTHTYVSTAADDATYPAGVAADAQFHFRSTTSFAGGISVLTTDTISTTGVIANQGEGDSRPENAGVNFIIKI